MQSSLLSPHSAKPKPICIEYSKENTTIARIADNLKKIVSTLVMPPKRNSQIHTLASFTPSLKCLGKQFTLKSIHDKSFQNLLQSQIITTNISNQNTDQKGLLKGLVMGLKYGFKKSRK